MDDVDVVDAVADELVDSGNAAVTVEEPLTDDDTKKAFLFLFFSSFILFLLLRAAHQHKATFNKSSNVPNAATPATAANGNSDNFDFESRCNLLNRSSTS